MLEVIYRRISERLEAMGLNHREACRLAGISPESIRSIRRAIEDGVPGRRGVSTRNLAALAPVLGTSVDWLLGGKASSEDGALAFIEWGRLETCSDLDRAIDEGGRLDATFGQWSRRYFATRTPDEAMNRMAPAGAYIVVDSEDLALIGGGAYLGLLSGRLLFRRWEGEPDRVEPYSTDPNYRTAFLSKDRPWQVIGRVRRVIVEA